MKTYAGKLNAGGVGSQVIWVERSEEFFGDYQLPHIVRHSPDGFNWGYGGSGPADIALSILTDCVGNDVANVFYQRFKSEFVAGWKESFEITAKEIKDWLLLITKDEKY